MTIQRLFSIAPPILANLLLLTSVVLAQDEGVHWKFATGDQFSAVQQQSTVMNTRVDKRQTRINSSVQLKMLWEVKDVSDDQTATIQQTVQSIEVVIDDPADASKLVKIDTASEERPARKSRELQKQLKSVVGIQFAIQMTALGEILSVDVPDSTAEKLAGIPEDSWLKAMLDPGKLQGQITGSTIILPSELLDGSPSEGQTWKLENPVNSQTVVALDPGQRVLAYVGSKEVGGETLDEFRLSTSAEFDAAKAKGNATSDDKSLPHVATFVWAGELWFNRQDGHCSRCDHRTTIRTEASHGEMNVSTELQVDSTFRLQRKPGKQN